MQLIRILVGALSGFVKKAARESDNVDEPARTKGLLSTTAPFKTMAGLARQAQGQG
jgi:hypothetical protein